MKRALLLFGVLVFLGGVLLSRPTPLLPAKQVFAQETRASKQQLSPPYPKLPLSFEANVGQTDAQVKFLSRGPGYTLFLTATEAVLVFSRGSPPAVLRMRFAGANPATHVRGLQELPSKSNYFIANDPAKWRSNVPHYNRVRYEEVYPGIELIFYERNPRQLEYDFVVSPGADPEAITLVFEGAQGLELGSQGSLILHLLAAGHRPAVVHPTVRLLKPLIYQHVGDTRREISGGYVLRDANHVGFEVASYDRTRPLIIDPVLVYSTYLGGSDWEESSAITLDSTGNAYVTGFTRSVDFPVTSGAFQTSKPPNLCGLAACDDVFVTKFNANGSGLVYSTYLGGRNDDMGGGIAVDAAGNVYVTGETRSEDFPTSVGAFDTVCGRGTCGNSGNDAFVTKLDPTGSALIYSTFLGEVYGDVGHAIAVDSLGNAYVTGRTVWVSPIVPSGFPITPNAVQPVHGGGLGDGFMTKFNPSGSGVEYSTFLGGSFDDHGTDIAVDSTSNVYVTGVTASTDFPTVNALQPANASGACCDAFVTKFGPSGSLGYSTYLGGTGGENVFTDGSIAADSLGNAYVTGETTSTDFPTANAFQPGNAGPADAFVSKLNPDGSAFVYSTYLGGSGADQALHVAVDSEGSAYVTGVTGSADFPTVRPLQPVLGFQDPFITKLNPSGSALAYSTYLGGSGNDWGVGIAVDTDGNAYVTGLASAGFPTTPGSFQPTFAGRLDSFVAKVSDPAGPAVTLSSRSLNFGNQVVGTTSPAGSLILTNSGTADLAITSVTLTAANPEDFTKTDDNCSGATIVPGSSCTISVAFTPTAFGNRSANLTITDNALDSPQSVPLSGTGIDFAFSVSPTSQSVRAGQSAGYAITVSPQGSSFDAAIALSCSNLPSLTSCSFSPTSVTPGASPATSTLTVSTTAPSALLMPPFGQQKNMPLWAFWLCLPGLALLGIALSHQQTRRQDFPFYLCFVCLVCFLCLQVACGGGGQQPAPQPTPRPGTTPGTYTITIAGTSGSLQRSTTATLIVQ